MFKAKQVQTIDVAEMMDRIMENHDSKLALDRLKRAIDGCVHEKATEMNDEDKIRKDAEKGYSWNYKDPIDNIPLSVKEIAEIIGYETPVEDAQIFYECNEKYKKYYAESHKEEEE